MRLWFSEAEAAAFMTSLLHHVAYTSMNLEFTVNKSDMLKRFS